MGSELLAGTVVAGFRVESLIGQGAMGAVYLAEDATTGRRVALKLLVPELTNDERFRQRFMREAEIAATLDHPHIVPTLTFGEEGGRLYLAMAYVEGSDLRELLLRDSPLEPTRTVRLIGQVADALDAAHAAGLVHRDVKPGNILVAADGDDAYVCDFGLARHVSSVSSLTGDRGFVGTIDYVPPEQIAGRPIDRRADVYSLGCVFYECLTGERPFERESELALIYAHLNDAPRPVTELSPELPEALNGVVATALAKAPDQRYATCGKFIAAAGAALAGGTPSGRRSRRRPGIAMVALLTAVAGGIFGYAFTREDTSSTAGSPRITQASIAGVVLGGPEATYKQHFGGYKQLVLTEADPPIPGLSFGQPEVAVYFRADARRADIITTWNRHLRTAAGIGPCSTIEEMTRAYGKAVQPSWSGTSPDGNTVHSWVVGQNLLFATQDQRTISAVALYRGKRTDTKAGSPQAWANFVAAVETPCI